MRREAVARALASADGGGVDDAVARFARARPEALGRLDRLIAQLETEGVGDLAVLTVALRQIRGAI